MLEFSMATAFKTLISRAVYILGYAPFPLSNALLYFKVCLKKKKKKKTMISLLILICAIYLEKHCCYSALDICFSTNGTLLNFHKKLVGEVSTSWFSFVNYWVTVLWIINIKYCKIVFRISIQYPNEQTVKNMIVRW